jgi:hypothetical protein
MSPENLFERIVTVDNLRNAWIKAKHHAQTEAVYFDAYAYDAFEERPLKLTSRHYTTKSSMIHIILRHFAMSLSLKGTKCANCTLLNLGTPW